MCRIFCLAWVLIVFTCSPALADKPQKRKKKKSRSTTTSKVEKDTELGRLVELNSDQLFGGVAKVKDGKVEITYNKSGQLKSGFTGGVLDAESDIIIGANRSFIMQGGDIYPGFAAIGLKDGLWVSKFPLKGATQLEFGFRIPNLVTQESNFKAIINWNPKKKSGFATNFFNKISRISRGKEKGSRLTPIKQYQRTASYWFPRKNDPVPIKFGIDDKGCAVALNGKELVRVGKFKDLGGHVAFMYSKIGFTLHDLVVRGDLDTKWAKKEIKRLRKAGELVEKAPDPPTEDAAEESDENAKVAKADEAKGEEDEIDSNADDEADDDSKGKKKKKKKRRKKS